MISSDSLSFEHFDIRDVCGVGATSTVVHAVHRASAAEVALKHVSRRWMHQAGTSSAVQAEINVLRRLRHRHIMRLFSFFKTPEYVVLVLEPCEYSLRQLLDEQPRQRFPEEQAIGFALQIASALVAVHDAGFAHRDLKLENVLIRKGMVKLADFGCVRQINAGQFTRCGTLDYVAPEMILRQPHSEKVDIWAFGVIIVELVTSCPPFFSPLERETLHRIVHDEPILGSMSPALADLVRWMLCKAPQGRPTALDVEAALQHL